MMNIYYQIQAWLLHPSATDEISEKKRRDIIDYRENVPSFTEFSSTVNEGIHQTFSNFFFKEHMRVFITYMIYIELWEREPSTVSFRKVWDILNKASKKKKPKALQILGNYKEFKQSLKDYKTVSHLILAIHTSFCLTKFFPSSDEDEKEEESFLLVLLCLYFQRLLLQLPANKHGQSCWVFKEEDFAPLPLEKVVKRHFSLDDQEEWRKEFEEERKKIWKTFKDRLKETSPDPSFSL